ncbi:ArdC-like ssDNA-binding domain-containing protein [Neobacillus pocheonensis]|uniref:ArdC-like ssDNA-binding domain-containing protein n=1 Tax=Neobacillus pocheonensis TaxID=363869 RepID=UPI003D2A4D06
MTKTNHKEPKVNELYAKLKEGVQKVYFSDKWKEILLFQSRFHNYSFNNMMLIYFQCPTATFVAGYTDWQKLGRQVQYKQEGIKILAPSYKIEKDEQTGEKKKKLVGFHQTSVFDVSQTKGAPLPSLTHELTMETATLRDFYETLKAVCPFPVEEKTITNGSKGYFDHLTQSIAVKKGMAALHKCKTLVHEMAHGYLHTNSDKSKEMKEVEAEGTAFVVLSYFGFDTSNYSFPYVAGWNGSAFADHIQKAGDTIQKTAEKLIAEIEKEMSKKSAAA